MLVMPKNSSLQLLSEPSLKTRSQPGCLMSSSTPARYKPPAAGAWLDPGNWRPVSDVTPLPHSDQVPCQHDTAVFPPDMTYKVSIRDHDINVARVSVNNKNLDTVQLRSMFLSQVGSRMFNVTRRVQVTNDHCRDRTGCQCGTDHLYDTICSYAGGDKCQETKCSSPLKPAGHCCYNYCGAVINIMAPDLDMSTVSHIARSHGAGHTLVHVRRLRDRHQIMLVPDNSGNLTMTHQTAAEIQNFLLVELDQSARVWTEYSGAGPPPGLVGKEDFPAIPDQ